MKKTVTVLLAVLLVFAMAACTSNGGSGAAGDSNTAAGTYKMKSMSMAGVQVDMETLATAVGLSIDDLKIELKDGGDFTMTMLSAEESVTVNGTWTLDGTKLSMTAEGDTMEATLDGTKLTISDSDRESEMVFEK